MRIRLLVLVFFSAAMWCGDEPAIPADQADFLARCGAIAATTESRVVQGKDGWLFLRGELRHLGTGAFWGEAAQQACQSSNPEWRDPLVAILAIKAQLDELGIELLVVPTPPRALIYADKLDAGVPLDAATRLPLRADPHHRAFYALLREKGVVVLDLIDRFLLERCKDATEGPVCCRTDSHWSPRGIAIAAEEIHRVLGDRPWAQARRGKADDVVLTTAPLSFIGDLADGIPETDRVQETLPLMRFTQRHGDGTETAIVADPTSPLLLVADSHGLVFGAGEDLHATQGALTDHLASRFAFPIDAMSKRGSASTIFLSLARPFYQQAGYRDGKRCIVWCLRTMDFSESAGGWRSAPLTLKKE